jgi:hypothetical protein
VVSHVTISMTVFLERPTLRPMLSASPEALAAHGALKAAGKLRLTVTAKPTRQTLRPTLQAAEGRPEEEE